VVGRLRQFAGGRRQCGNRIEQYTSSIYGTAVGADYLFSPNTIAGFALAGAPISASMDRAPAIPICSSSAHMCATPNRIVTAAGFDQLQAKFNANAFSERLEGGYRFVAPWTGGLGITPYAAAQFTTFDLLSYAESVLSGSGAFALAYGAKDVTDTRSELGIRTEQAPGINQARSIGAAGYRAVGMR
jgi:uncharacterized protein with beta-barrel porin domain